LPGSAVAPRPVEPFPRDLKALPASLMGMLRVTGEASTGRRRPDRMIAGITSR
jgi:hypothetical protein